jgi:hypothetical protein
MANYIPMFVALLGWLALWVYLISLDSKVKRMKKDE